MQHPSSRNVAEGISFCIDNAEKYLDSSKVLYEKDQTQQAYLLGLYALEEMGKVPLIWNCLFYSKKEEDWKRWLVRFKSHKEKFWFSKDIDDFTIGNFAKDSNRREQQKASLKENVSYVNYIGNKFSKPKNINRTEIEKLINIAIERLTYLKSRHHSVDKDEEEIRTALQELSGMGIEDLKKLAEQKRKSMGSNSS